MTRPVSTTVGWNLCTSEDISNLQMKPMRNILLLKLIMESYHIHHNLDSILFQGSRPICVIQHKCLHENIFDIMVAGSGEMGVLPEIRKLA